jgi:hypothetical protein
MCIIFLERSKKITIGPGKEASSPHISTTKYVFLPVIYLLATQNQNTRTIASMHSVVKKIVALMVCF